MGVGTRPSTRADCSRAPSRLALNKATTSLDDPFQHFTTPKNFFLKFQLKAIAGTEKDGEGRPGGGNREPLTGVEQRWREAPRKEVAALKVGLFACQMGSL